MDEIQLTVQHPDIYRQKIIHKHIKSCVLLNEFYILALKCYEFTSVHKTNNKQICYLLYIL